MLAPGTRLGVYEVVAPLGAGGMGEVYKAKDTRLDRFVAIKVLPAHVSSDPALRERFEREARTVAALNHPHICTLHDVGHEGGTDFLVMEYLEGETLAERLAKGALPLEQAVSIAIQIADALAVAHRAGIIHRDLKPGNVILTKSGAKLLDFGLAKMTPAVVAASGLSTAPTGETPMTAQGTILGTLQDMAPEQLEGQQVDARTDIFALGAVAYEMATGKKAFVAKSQASLIGAILKDDPPPISSLQPMTPPNLDRVVQTCLAKDPDERWQTAQDLKKQLTWIVEDKSQARTLPAVPPSGIHAHRRSASVWTLGFILLVVSGFAIWNLKTTRVTRPQPVSRFTITLPPGERFPVSSSDQVGSQSWLAISPDGRNLAYVATRGPGWQLYLRSMDSLESKLIPGTEQAVNPFFSPDGQWLGFMADGKLRKVSVSGGAAVTLADSALTSGASWGSLDGIVFVSEETGVLQQVSDGGTAPRPLTRLEEGETAHSWPESLPDVGAVLFTGGTGTRPVVAVHSIESGQRKDLIPGATYPRYARSGHLLYAREGTVMAVPFDQQRLQTTGTAVPVLEGVLQPSAASQRSIGALRLQVVEASIADLEAAYLSGRTTAHAIAQAHLDRISAYDKRGPLINALITVNPRALEEADRLDALLKTTGKPVGPLHGVPVIVKDNIDVADLPMTSGFQGWKNYYPAEDAPLVKKLRAAGGIILAKSSLSEFAYGIADNVNSVLSGFARNPYNTAFATGGSSGGSAAAVAASFGVVAIGTDTGGSVRMPSAFNALAGLRPTVGLVSRTGMVPLNSVRDTAGPIGRTVGDMAILLDVIAGPDPEDEATARATGHRPPTYSAGLRREALKGARLGVLRQVFGPSITDPRILAHFETTLAELKAAGAEIIDPFVAPELGSIPRGPQPAQFKDDLTKWIVKHPGIPFPSVKEIADSRLAHPLHQAFLDASAAARPVSEDPETIEGLKSEQRYREGFARAMDAGRIDAVVFPTSAQLPPLNGDRNTQLVAEPRPAPNAGPTALAGGLTIVASALQWPALSVPSGYLGEGLPQGLQILGRAWDDAKIIGYAYAYEQATHHRRPPLTVPPLTNVRNTDRLGR